MLVNTYYSIQYRVEIKLWINPFFLYFLIIFLSMGIRLYIRFVVFLFMDGLSSLILSLGVFVSIIFIAHVLIKRDLRHIRDSEQS